MWGGSGGPIGEMWGRLLLWLLLLPLLTAPTGIPTVADLSIDK